jgi:hypothetical protein
MMLLIPSMPYSYLQKIQLTLIHLFHQDIITNHLPILKTEAEAILNHQTGD